MHDTESSDEAAADHALLLRTPRDLRDAVYRRGAQDSDREALTRALADLAPEVESSPERRSGAAPRRALLALTVVVIVAVAALTEGFGLDPPQRRTVPSAIRSRTVTRPVAFLGDVEDRRRQQFALSQLFRSHDAPDLREFLLTHHFSGAITSTRAARVVTGRADGPHTWDIGDLAAAPPPTSMTVLFTCSKRTALRWVLTAPGAEHDDPTSIRGRAAECSGRLLAATVPIAPGQSPTALEARVKPGVRVLMTVVALHGQPGITIRD